MIRRSKLLTVVVFVGSLALGAALLLTVAVPASHAQNQRYVNYGMLFCSVHPTFGGYAYIYPPAVFSSTAIYWTAWVYHYDIAGNYTGAERTDWFYYTPPDPYYITGGGWKALMNPTLNLYLVRANISGSVYIVPFIYNEAGQLLVNGGFWADSCRVV